MFMRQVSRKVRLAVRLINIKQFGRFAGEQEVKRLSISTRLKYKMCHMSELHQTRRCTSASPHRQSCCVRRSSEERVNKPTDRRRFLALHVSTQIYIYKLSFANNSLNSISNWFAFFSFSESSLGLRQNTSARILFTILFWTSKINHKLFDC